VFARDRDDVGAPGEALTFSLTNGHDDHMVRN
jgi:hypothetical protein